MPSADGIHLSAATATLAGRVVIPPLSLSLTERRIGIVGRNGSGKSTLLRLIGGLVAPSSGTVRVDGIDPSGDRRGLIARLGILFQNPDHQIIFPLVEEELAFGLRQRGLGRDGALAAARARLAAEGRAHWAAMPATSLSQGQRHFLCLLSVLMMEPATLLLDEPFAGLDLPTTARLRRALDAAPQRLVTVTHDPAMLASYDRAIWLEEGRVAGDGPPAAVLDAYAAAMEERARDADTHLAG